MRAQLRRKHLMMSSAVWAVRLLRRSSPLGLLPSLAGALGIVYTLCTLTLAAAAPLALPAQASAEEVPAQLGQRIPECEEYKGPKSQNIIPDGTAAPLPTKRLTTRGNRIWDAEHNVPFRLRSVNWYGAEEQNMVVDGLQVQTLSAIVREIKEAGFNSVRLPISNEMVELSEKGRQVCPQAVTANKGFAGLTPLQVLGRTIEGITRQGLLVILDDHSTNASWSGAQGSVNGLWYDLPGFTTEDWENDWRTIVKDFGSMEGVVGVDLRNEPRENRNHESPTWEMDNLSNPEPRNWQQAASEAAGLVLSEDPNLLVLVEGIEYATNLEGVRAIPVEPISPNSSFSGGQSPQVVYEAHDYAFDHTGQLTKGIEEENQRRWGYLLGEGHAVWIGEFGTCNNAPTCFDASSSAYNGLWFNQFTNYLRHHPEVSWSYWPLNGVNSPSPQDNVGDEKKWGHPEEYGVMNTTWNGFANQELLTALSHTKPASEENLSACTANTLPANDDGSTGLVSLPFTVDFFGTSHSSLYVNNNGNVTFEAPLSTYTPFGLIGAGTPIIAPFFADVDTRGVGSGVVTYGGAPAEGGNPAYFCVDWFDVGYYGAHTDKTNTFQLVLYDRSGQTGHLGDFDIEFNYDGIQWEAGDASGGFGGFGGSSARAGYSNGTTRSAEIFGSGENGALWDGGPLALTDGNQNSTELGRYIFPVRNGGAQAGGTFKGSVTDTGTPPGAVSDATLQFCTIAPASSVCAIGSTNALGDYSVTGLPPGEYDVRVSPPSGSTLFERDLGPIALADQATVQLDVALSGPRGLTPGTTITDLHRNPDGTPVLDWSVANTLTTHGCVGGSAAYTMTIAGNQHGNAVSEQMAESPAVSGVYTATIPPLRPQYGPADVVITITCPNPAQNATIEFNAYIDPAGSVVDTGGNPVAGATVTLYRSDAATGPFTAVPNGSSVMSPANRVNPDTTTATGRFGWDVLVGYYTIRASKTGCSAPGNPSQAYVESPPEQIPPAVDNLVLTLQCQVVATTLTLAPKAGTDRVGTQHTVTGKAKDASGSPAVGVSVVFSVTGANNAHGTATTDSNGDARFAYAGTHTGFDAISAFADNNANGTQDAGEPSDTASEVWYGLLSAGSFVIGDKNAAIGTSVTFWSAQWWKLNSLSGGSGPASLKGFVNSPATAVCGKSWTTDPGNSTPPPVGPLPEYMAVIVSNRISKAGPTISGNTLHEVIVKTNPGYAPNPGQAGTGTVLARIC